MKALILVMVDTKIALCHLIASDTLLHSEVHGESPQYQMGTGKKKKKSVHAWHKFHLAKNRAHNVNICYSCIVDEKHHMQPNMDSKTTVLGEGGKKKV